jgi:hypothetical protein
MTLTLRGRSARLRLERTAADGGLHPAHETTLTPS